MADSPPLYDVLLFGATGFTGGLAAEYLAKNAPSNTRWAIAGRSRHRLDQIFGKLCSSSPACPPRGVVVADVGDPKSLLAMASSTRVLMSTVGPFARYGEQVVAACVQAGCDYVDITGEPEFVDRIRKKFDESARSKGIRIVPACGFDSLPHDLGALFTRKLLPQDLPVQMEGFVRVRGTISGGTWQTAVDAMGKMPIFRRRTKTQSQAGSPPSEPKPSEKERTVAGLRQRIRYERVVQGYVAPMPTIDPLIVLQSARKLSAYGPEFRYAHYVVADSLAGLSKLLLGVSGVFLLSRNRFSREWLRKQKSAGEGPSAERRARSNFSVTFVAKADEQKAIARVSGGDPGYDETSKMLAESALCLAFDRHSLPDRAGVLTTAEAMGDRLIDRLQAKGIAFEVLEAPEAVDSQRGAE